MPFDYCQLYKFPYCFVLHFKGSPGLTLLKYSQVDVLDEFDHIFGCLKGFLKFSLSGQLKRSSLPRFCFLDLTDLNRISASTVHGTDQPILTEQDVPEDLWSVIDRDRFEVVIGNEDFFTGLDVALCKHDVHPEIANVEVGRVGIARVAEADHAKADNRDRPGHDTVDFKLVHEGTVKRLQILQFWVDFGLGDRTASVNHDS